MMKYICCFMMVLFLSACSIETRLAGSNPTDHVHRLVKDPLTPDETGDFLSTAAGNWVYGQGLGDTAVKVGTSIIFPPFLVAWIGSAAVEMAGYEIKTPESFNRVYEGVTSIPGHVTAKVAGKEFRDERIANRKIERVLNAHEDPANLSDI